MRERWSWSRVVAFTRCGEAYRREHEEKEKAPPTSSMVRGTALHYVAAEGHLRQLKARTENPKGVRSIVLREALPSEEEAGDLAATRFDHEQKEVGIAAPSDDTKDTAPKTIIGRDRDTAIRMSKFYVTKVAPFLDPLYVERKIEIEPADVDIRLSMILDLGTRSEDGGEILRDTKTGVRNPPLDAADESGQLTMYALGRKIETGKLPDAVALDYIVAESKFLGPVYKVTLMSKRTDADIQVAVNRLNNAIAAVKAGVYVANGPGNWWCSPKWCRWHPTCSYVRHP